MNDLFIRQRLNAISGLTTYTQKLGTSTSIPAGGAWTDLNLTGISSPVDLHLIITAYKITTALTDAEVRMVVDTKKIFPHGDSMEVVSATDQFLHFPLQVPVGHTFLVQVSSVAGGTATLDYLSVIEVGQYTHA